MTRGVAEAGPHERGVGAAVGQAAFLACSWTWCIGMWFPVYLIHDFGAPGWVAFAAFNVLGAMGVGFVHRGRGAAAAFRDRGLGAMRWFSLITILFHAAFLGWWFFAQRPGFLPAEAAWAPAALALLAGWGLSFMPRGWWPRVAAGLLPAAPLLMLLALRTTNGQGLALPDGDGVVTAPAALPLYACGIAFGFLLCPHLDLTILRAREETPGAAGDAAFVIGFGGFFLMMIMITAAYASALLLGWFSHYVLLHVWVQATFTVGAHVRELRERGAPAGSGGGLGAAGMAVAAVALGVGVAHAPEVLDRPATRTAYESFLWLYALPLPMAAWFLLLGRRLGAHFWGAVAVAGPMVGAGALMGVWWAVPTGVGVALVAGVMAPRRGPTATSGTVPTSPL